MPGRTGRRPRASCPQPTEAEQRRQRAQDEAGGEETGNHKPDRDRAGAGENLRVSRRRETVGEKPAAGDDCGGQGARESSGSEAGNGLLVERLASAPSPGRPLASRSACSALTSRIDSTLGSAARRALSAATSAGAASGAR